MAKQPPTPTEKAFGNGDMGITKYAIATFHPEDEVLKEIRVRSKSEGLPDIHVGEMDGLHLEVLVRATGAKKAVEIGTLAGYSGVCIARALGPKGFLHTFEFEEKHAKVATESFRKAGVLENVKVHVGPALQNLKTIEKEGPFDLVFVDANKEDYPGYLKWAEENLKIGGLLMADNTFAWGLIHKETLDHQRQEQPVQALRTFNKTVATSSRFRATIMPTGEGLTLAVKIK